MNSGGTFLVASDGRRRDSSVSDALSDALANGLRLTGLTVVNLGTLPECMMRYAMRRTRSEGCVFLSATPGADGLCKLRWTLENAACTAAPTATAAMMPELLASAERFIRQERPEIDVPARLPWNSEWEPGAKLRETLGAISLEVGETSRSLRVAKRISSVRFLDVSFDYVTWLQDIGFGTPHRPHVSGRIVLDPQFGIWSGRARKYLQAIFPHRLVTAIRDGFEAHPEAENMFGHAANTPLCEEVDRLRADLGFLLGNNGGWIVAVDGLGFALSHEELNWLFLQSFAGVLQGEPLIHDPCCSSRLISEAKRFGAEPLCVPMDETSFRERMALTGAPLGIGSGGNHYFRAICGENDALFSICFLIDFLVRSEKKLEQWRESIPRFSMTGEIWVPLDEKKSRWQDLFQYCRENLTCTFHSGNQMRCEVPGGWFFLGRFSSACPESSAGSEISSLLVRIEADQAEALEHPVRRCCAILDEYGRLGKRVWSAFSG